MSIGLLPLTSSGGLEAVWQVGHLRLKSIVLGHFRVGMFTERRVLEVHIFLGEGGQDASAGGVAQPPNTEPHPIESERV